MTFLSSVARAFLPAFDEASAQSKAFVPRTARHRQECLCHWIVCFFLALSTGEIARADAAAAPDVSGALRGVGVEQHLGARLPLDAMFRDSDNREVRLGDYFHGRPVLLTPIYYGCPRLCTMTLNQLTRSLTALKESVGDRFDIVTFSIDPSETPALAAQKKKAYLHSYRRDSASDGWHFLVGDQGSIDRVAQAVGFGYRWDPAQQAFAHASAVIVCTPDGTVSRYFLGVDYPPNDVRDALNAAAGGNVAPKPAEAVFFYCMKYDPETGRYGLMIGRTLRLLGAATLVGVVGLIVALHRSSARRIAPAVTA